MGCEEKGRFALVDLQQHVAELRQFRQECEAAHKFFKVRRISTNVVAYCCDAYGDTPDGTVTDQGAQYETPDPASGKKSNCLIATAAYGTDVDAELAPLRAFRDDLAGGTRWGRDFFERYERVYYSFSPEISARMREDAEMRELVKNVFVIPWVNYFTLAMRRPADWSLHPDNEELASFLAELQNGFDQWSEFVELPEELGSLPPEQAVAELNLVLDYVLKGRGLAFLDELVGRGELPLRCADGERTRLREALLGADRTNAEIERILGADALSS